MYSRASVMMVATGSTPSRPSAAATALQFTSETKGSRTFAPVSATAIWPISGRLRGGPSTVPAIQARQHRRDG